MRENCKLICPRSSAILMCKWFNLFNCSHSPPASQSGNILLRAVCVTVVVVLLAVFVLLFYKLKIKRKRVQCKLLLLFIKFLLKGKKKTRFCYILQMWTREVMEEIWRYFSLKSVISAITPCHPTNLFVGLSVCLIGCLFVLDCCLWWCCWSLPKCHWRVNIPGAQQQGRSSLFEPPLNANLHW